MNLASLSGADLVGVLLGFILTICVFSYVLGDNALFRIAIHIFIGVTAGIAIVQAWVNVIWPQLFVPIISNDQPQALIIRVTPLLLSVLLLAKIWPRLASLGGPAVAYMVGAGAAAGVGGAVLGTVFTQASASVNIFASPAISQVGPDAWLQLANAIIVLIGTLTALIYFQFRARSNPDGSVQRSMLVEGLAWIGQFFIAITLGTFFAGIYMAALTAFVERWHFIVHLFLPFLLPR